MRRVVCLVADVDGSLVATLHCVLRLAQSTISRLFRLEASRHKQENDNRKSRRLVGTESRKLARALR